MSDSPVQSVRPATAEDATAMGAIQAAAWRHDGAALLPSDALDGVDPTAFARAWENSLGAPPTPRHVALLALDGALPVGLAAIGPSDDPDADVTTALVFTLNVHPAHRRRGHGSRLVNACVDTLREMGFTWADTWLLVADETSRAFFTAAGMVPDQARRQREVSPEHTVMEVRLGASLEAQ